MSAQSELCYSRVGCLWLSILMGSELQPRMLGSTTVHTDHLFEKKEIQQIIPPNLNYIYVYSSASISY